MLFGKKIKKCIDIFAKVKYIKAVSGTYQLGGLGND